MTSELCRWPLTKRVLFEPIGGLHPSQRWLIQYPPSGYAFLTRNLPWDRRFDSWTKNHGTSFLTQGPPSRLLPLPLVKAYLDSTIANLLQASYSADLVYAYNHIAFHRHAWVSALEWFHVVTGFYLPHFFQYRRIIEKSISSDSCKGVFLWSQIAKTSFELNTHLGRSEEKIKVVPPAVPRRDFVKSQDTDVINLLFIGQGSTRDPLEFYYKGGLEVVTVFNQLCERYRNLRLWLRDEVPKDIRWLVSKNPKINLIETRLSERMLDELYKKSQIFVVPSHLSHNMVIPEAMSYEMPVVTTDAINNPEWVREGITGFLVKTSSEFPYFGRNLIPSRRIPELSKSFDAMMVTKKPNVLKQLNDKLTILIEDEALRRRMGKAARLEAETGLFSISARNSFLKRFFDNSLE
ncbi:MAG: glycosyltransferase family 4 protein [Nitrososphaerota archaeon]|nr:glycosyltransferase family 4 protein [Nitrososphaerota archaeon]